MYCIKCGNQLDDSDVFCGMCGTRVNQNIISRKNNINIHNMKINSTTIAVQIMFAVAALSSFIAILLTIKEWNTYIFDNKIGYTSIISYGVFAILSIIGIVYITKETYNEKNIAALTCIYFGVDIFTYIFYISLSPYSISYYINIVFNISVAAILVIMLYTKNANLRFTYLILSGIILFEYLFAFIIDFILDIETYYIWESGIDTIIHSLFLVSIIIIVFKLSKNYEYEPLNRDYFNKLKSNLKSKKEIILKQSKFEFEEKQIETQQKNESINFDNQNQFANPLKDRNISVEKNKRN